jgi:hypothetical protein
VTDSGPQDNPQNHDLIEGDAGVDKPSQAEGSEEQADQAQPAPGQGGDSQGGEADTLGGHD